MSEEKLYAVKTDEGEFLSFSDDGDSVWNKAIGHFETDKQKARSWAYNRGGHVVTLVEEPKKVKLPKKAAEWIDSVKNGGYDITYIFTDYAMPNEVSDWLEDSDDEAEHREERGLMLINAYLYGYTVAKEKKYLVYKVLGGKQKHELFAQAYRPAIFPDTITWSVGERRTPKTGVSAQFTEAEIERYGLQDCKKEEVTDDAD